MIEIKELNYNVVATDRLLKTLETKGIPGQRAHIKHSSLFGG